MHIVSWWASAFWVSGYRLRYHYNRWEMFFTNIVLIYFNIPRELRFRQAQLGILYTLNSTATFWEEHLGNWVAADGMGEMLHKWKYAWRLLYISIVCLCRLQNHERDLFFITKISHRVLVWWPAFAEKIEKNFFKCSHHLKLELLFMLSDPLKVIYSYTDKCWNLSGKREKNYHIYFIS